jgi:hypothetical protein
MLVLRPQINDGFACLANAINEAHPGSYADQRLDQMLCPECETIGKRPAGLPGREQPNGGRDRDRTCDPLDVNEVLSR